MLDRRRCSRVGMLTTPILLPSLREAQQLLARQDATHTETVCLDVFESVSD